MNEETEKRDELAKKRTLLANERTLLAYIRTTLAAIGLGIFLIKYQPTDLSLIIGIVIIIFAAVVLVASILKFRMNKKQIDKF
ncbi:MAG TPA: DUF202 domain-containing protein [Bacteroidales bacterium]|jgi:putative membrane protein|nr:DUF202 domain-containing protein [Bacteroidales bacterium]HPB25214.1 DUF202 domain-containing protein [Bacteroidales bacterium]HPI29938.1 DUF202 domain-containing protein [Bacteroidales bacterium]HQN16021.1 DUF202 domain-containing protein [Bacteroidales bacterium]HQP15639.1 DUF202 domain-containing protein [Bacteroidales bacterium]